MKNQRNIHIRDYYANRDFERYDWPAEANPEGDKGEDEYDVIVVGSGMGGLSCAALLSKWGYRVLVLEHNSRVGGYYGSFERNGFIFNNGASEITGLWQDGPTDIFLDELGLSKEDFFVPNSYKYKLGAIEITPFDGAKGVMEQLSKQFPHEVSNISSFFTDAQKAHEEWFRDASVYGTPLPPELIVKLSGEDALREQLKRKPHYYDWWVKSWRMKLDEFFASDDIKDLIDFLLNHTSIDPDRTPPEVALRDYGYFCHGSLHPKGGAQRLVDAISEFIEDHGGRVLLGNKVRKILVEKGQATGVMTGDKIFRSRVVVSNANIKSTLLQMVDPAIMDDDFVASIEALRIQRTYFTVFIGVDMELANYPSIMRILDEDRGEFYFLAIHSNADPYMAPQGQASISISTSASYDEFPNRGTEAYSKRKAAYSSHLVEMAGKLISGLKERIIVQDSATPKTLERYTLAPEGSGEGFFWSTEVQRPCFKTPIRGLYLVGSSTYPGPGVENVLMSGVICANDINGWKAR